MPAGMSSHTHVFFVLTIRKRGRQGSKKDTRRQAAEKKMSQTIRLTNDLPDPIILHYTYDDNSTTTGAVDAKNTGSNMTLGFGPYVISVAISACGCARYAFPPHTVNIPKGSHATAIVVNTNGVSVAPSNPGVGNGHITVGATSPVSSGYPTVGTSNPNVDNSNIIVDATSPVSSRWPTDRGYVCTVSRDDHAGRLTLTCQAQSENGEGPGFPTALPKAFCKHLAAPQGYGHGLYCGFFK